MSDLNKIESVLFAAARFVSATELSKFTGVDQQEIAGLVNKLKDRIDGSSLIILEHEETYKLAVHDQYTDCVAPVVHAIELPQNIMETLAIIAWKYPVVQSEIVKLRGPSAYDHMHQLVDRGFVRKESFGRTYKLVLTKQFFKYFDLPSEASKQAFLDKIPGEIQDTVTEMDGEIDTLLRTKDTIQSEKNTTDEIKKAMMQLKTS